MNKEMNESRKKISELLYSIEGIIYFFRRENYDRALRISKTIIDKISKLLESLLFLQNDVSSYVMESQEQLQMILSNIIDAQKSNDYILMADLYELQLSPWLKGIQENIIGGREPYLCEKLYVDNRESLRKVSCAFLDELKTCSIQTAQKQGYQLEYTSSGELTLLRDNTKYHAYFHSNVFPSWEGFCLSQGWYDIDKRHYYIIGMGLGYAVMELLKKSPFVEVTVLESDLNVISLALQVNDFSNYIIEERLNIIYDRNYKELGNYIQKLKQDEEVIIHGPSMKNIEIPEIREAVENYFLQYHSMKNQYALLKGNFLWNQKRADSCVDELKDKFEGKTIYIVAAGPSLDKNFRLLKQVKDGVILATGTVYKKLLKEGIQPDYVIVSDANERVYGQIKGVEQEQIPMIYLSTATYKFAANYQGRKYIAYQKGFTLAEDYAKEQGKLLIETGGSVTTTALDISLQLGCKRVVFLGLDLAYTDGYVHAENTSLRKLSSEENLRTVIDIHGDKVRTSKSLTLYLRWIEERIKRSPNVEFFDATEGGARIDGTKIEALKDVLKIVTSK